MTSARLPRRDAYAYDHIPPDRGCSWHPSCLACPEVVCRFETGASGGSRTFGSRAAEAWRLNALGLHTDEIALRMNVSRRQVFRYLAAHS